MKTLVFLLEEPSAREMLQGVLPRLVPDEVEIKYVVFEGKSDLEKRMKYKIRGWLKPDTSFIVMRDQDFGDCRLIKSKLKKKCKEAGRADTLVRVACRELESFYLGDLAAVERGLEIKGLAATRNKSKYCYPDEIGKPSEELARITKNKYQKVLGSRSIAPFLALDESNRSHSFQVLLQGIKALLDR